MQDDRARRSFWTVGRKVIAAVAAAVTLGFVSMVTVDIADRRDDAWSSAVESNVAIANLLAAQMSGGVRWKKADVVAATYADLTAAPGSTVASITVLDGAGAAMVSYKADGLARFDLAPDLVRDVLADGKAATARRFGHNLVVAVPVTAGKEKDVVGTLGIAFDLARVEHDVREGALMQAGIGLAVLALLVLVLALAVRRFVTRPILGMTGAMSALARGDRGVAIPGLGGGDELGAMAAALQVFEQTMAESERLRAEQEETKARAAAENRAAVATLADDFERSMRSLAQSLTASAGAMQTSARTMSVTAEETSRQTAAVAAGSEEASTNVQTVAAAAEELSASVHEISRQVSQSAAITGRAVEEAARSNASVRDLAEAAQKIGEVVKLINDIAGQTNLLALNATIEAARAGEAGKGFAVVASEVKSLATQTAKATEDIAAQIGAIQAATRNSVAAIEGIGSTIGEVNQIAAAIASAVEEQGAATQEIARNVQQAARGTGEVSSNIAGVSESAQQTGQLAGQVLAAAAGLTRQAETLLSEVDTLLATIRAA